ncbi:hypothetical protein [Salinispora pacifica]|nr:hypothetical protein [Salinispora pacifica]
MTTSRLGRRAGEGTTVDGLAAADGGGANPALSVPPEYEQLKHCIALD